MVELRTLYQMVRGSNPGLCSFSALENKGLRGALWQRKILALHFIHNLRVEDIIIIRFDLKLFILGYNTQWYVVQSPSVLLLRFGLKLFILRYNI